MKKLMKEAALIALVLAPYIVVAYLWNELPQTVPTHFGMDGKPNGWSDKSLLLFLPGALGLLIYIIMLVAPVLDPKHRINEMEGKYYSLRVILTLLISCISVYIVILAQQGSMKNPGWLFALIGGFFALMGNYFQTVRPNYFIGIRTPWTLESDVVWKKTHVLAGRIWMIGGILIVLTMFVVADFSIQFPVFMMAIGVMVIVPVVQSYRWYKQEQKIAHG